MKQNIKIFTVVGLAILFFVTIGFMYLFFKSDSGARDGAVKIPPAETQDSEGLK